MKQSSFTFLALALALTANAETTTTSISTPAATTLHITTEVNTGPAPMSEPDQHIVATIYDKYAKSAALVGTAIKAVSQNGAVTLSGNVTAQSQADEAVSIAKATPGVSLVNTEIVVKTNANPPSNSLTPQSNY